MKLIFYMLLILVAVVRHAQVTQDSKFAESMPYSQIVHFWAKVAENGQ